MGISNGFAKKENCSEFQWEGPNNIFSTGRKDSGRAKSSIGDNLFAGERRGDPQLYVEGKQIKVNTNLKNKQKKRDTIKT